MDFVTDQELCFWRFVGPCGWLGTLVSRFSEIPDHPTTLCFTLEFAYYCLLFRFIIISHFYMSRQFCIPRSSAQWTKQLVCTGRNQLTAARTTTANPIQHDLIAHKRQERPPKPANTPTKAKQGGRIPFQQTRTPCNLSFCVKVR